MKKNLLYQLLWALPILILASCSSDVDDPYIPSEETTELITNKSGDIVVNTSDITVGESDDDMVFERISTTFAGGKKNETKTLNCCAMGGTNIIENPNSELKMEDTVNTVTDVTLINRGTITVHTKKLVEKYSQYITTPEEKKDYEYLRIQIMLTGKSGTLINEGKINVYFDHSPDTRCTVYVMAMVGDTCSNIINRGEINFYGDGSPTSRYRGMATFGNYVTCINEGSITSNVLMSEDARGITNGGTYGTIINSGTIDFRGSGMLLGMTRYGDCTITNSGTISLTMTDMPDGYKTVRPDDWLIAAGLFEAIGEKRYSAPPMENRGTISVNLENTEASEDYRQAYGFVYHGNASTSLDLNLINTGTVDVTQSGPKMNRVAEFGVVLTQARPALLKIKMLKWKTRLRDFASTQDLFIGRGISFDVSGGELILERPSDYVNGTKYTMNTSAIFKDVGTVTLPCEVTGFDNMNISSADSKYAVAWDKENETIALVDK